MAVTMDEIDLELAAGEPFHPAPFDAGQDLTGVALTFVARARDGASDVVSKAMTVAADPTTGTATLALAGTDTDDLVPGGDYRYKVRAQDGTVIVRGKLLVRRSWG